ncbi:unnamed protein product [Symbiodinium sp. CCMP2592]|nr:unnamed protein product [Symbiodinium sp. CCMP2592]
MPPWKQLPPDTPVLWTLDNPKQLGTTAYEKYEKYKSCTTLGAAWATGARLIDLNYDYKKGWLKMDFSVSASHNWGPCGLNGSREFFACLNIEDLGKLLRASRHVADTATYELQQRCRNFEYTGQFAPTIRSTRGRIHPSSLAEASRRLVLFLRSGLRNFFESLNLQEAPIQALQDPGLPMALKSMRALTKLVLPKEGWESSSKKRCFTGQPGVQVEFLAPRQERCSRLGRSKATRTDMHS